MAERITKIVKGVELRWAYLGEPCTKGEYASNKYQVDVILTPEQKKVLDSLGYSNKQKITEVDDGQFKVTLKSAKKPNVRFSTGIPLTDEQLKKVGNGTTANVRVASYEARGQRFLGLDAIAIKNLIEYNEGLDTDLFDDISGEDEEMLKSSTDDDDDEVDA